MVILKGKLNSKVSKDNTTRRLQMEGKKKVKKFFQSDKFGHVNVFMRFFPHINLYSVFESMLTKSILSWNKGEKAFFKYGSQNDVEMNTF